MGKTSSTQTAEWSAIGLGLNRSAVSDRSALGQRPEITAGFSLHSLVNAATSPRDINKHKL